MKKIIVILVCFASAMSFAQMTMKKLDGTPLNDGDVVTYTVLGDASGALDPDPAYFGYRIYNSSPTNISVKMKLISMSGGVDGNDLQFCIDPICIGSLIVGNSYPENNVSTVPANGANGNFDHFINYTAGTGNGIVDYVMKFYMLGSFGEEVGNSITLTYRYNPNLAVGEVSQVEKSDVIIKSTIVKNELILDVLKKVTVSIFDLNGKSVQNAVLNFGAHSLDTSNLSSGIYIVSFTSEEGNVSNKKIVKE